MVVQQLSAAVVEGRHVVVVRRSIAGLHLVGKLSDAGVEVSVVPVRVVQEEILDVFGAEAVGFVTA